MTPRVALRSSRTNASVALCDTAVGTDTGHRTANAADTRWAIGHPQQVVDFGYRAIHEAAVNAKRMVSAFYDRPPSRAYFGACSNGGRQALMEAQRYPEDYDGIIAGAPAHEWTSIYIGAGDWQFRQLADPARLVPAAKLPALRAAVVVQCHAPEGVIDEPQRCSFDPAVLACHGAETDQCLTPPQLLTVRGLYAGNVSARGQPLLRGYAVGSEAGLDDVHYRSGPGTDDFFPEALGFWRDLVFEDAAWDYRSYDMARDGALATRKLAAVLDADRADLSRCAARGGKLIVYHGWADPLPPPAGSIDPASKVVRTRPLCAWPRVARYGGTGSMDVAASFDCKSPG